TTAGGGGGGGGGSLRDCATSRSSALAVHRQCKSCLKLLSKPPVRISAGDAAASTIAAAMVARRTPSESPRVPTAPATKEAHKTGSASMGNRNPIAPPAIDLSIMREAPNIAATIRTGAVSRSSHAARLKNSHHRISNGVHASEPNRP